MFSERLKNLRAKKDISQAKLADMLGLSQQAIGSWETNKSSPDFDTLNKISDIFGVSTDYLLGKSVLGAMEDYADKAGLIKIPEEKKRVPIIGTVRCGPGGLAYDYLDGFVFVDENLGGDIRAFHCSGDSMIGAGIIDGDIAIVRIQSDVECGEIAVVVINGDEGTLKRVRKEDGAIILEAANSKYPARVFVGKEMNKLHIVGKVIQIRRNL